MAVWQIVTLTALCFVAFTIIGILLYSLSVRKKFTYQREKFEQIHLNLKSGDYVEFSNGIFGTVVKVDDETCDISIKSGAIMTVSRFAISEIITP
ncbi:preprotein translocase subunit YajC [Globicatella sanguinis]|uniref:preprotein translocase subunit YajC n=1 Tax=Globicatella sanguinis TaxID=13076 RepID=UPI00254287F0|nr:preprotein translocase subunit YajC [Globicatella sanguinis]MDK7630482.1 preprotein translocase subunit YajC [Globicatella sanguinis]WIK66219.1 preprotein translocase subunit YajC [Globicatella sanguinis]WKT55624.1 preprotein translocase subunit YajC [Globicatella sanguinis]